MAYYLNKDILNNRTILNKTSPGQKLPLDENLPDKSPPDKSLPLDKSPPDESPRTKASLDKSLPRTKAPRRKAYRKKSPQEKINNKNRKKAADNITEQRIYTKRHTGCPAHVPATSAFNRRFLSNNPPCQVGRVMRS